MVNAIVPDNYNKFIKGKPEYTCEKLLKKVSKKYHSISNAFIKRDADMLLEHRSKDHSIQLEEGKNLPFIRSYKPLSDQENSTMIKYIQENLGKEFIRPGLSAAAAPALLIKKLGGGLRFCVDYQALNAVTVKN